MTGERPRLPALDGLRGGAALLIAVYHVWLLSGRPRLGSPAIRDFLSSGFLAVSLFFVLSGFLLFLPTVLRGGHFGSVRSYAVRRVARVVPAYYLALALGLIFFGLLTSRAMSDAVTPGSVVAHLGFAQNEARLIPGYDGQLGFGVDPVVWTLSVEAAFYLLLPLVAVAWFRRPLAGLAGVIVAVTAARLALQGHSRNADILLSSFPLHAVEFAAGMTAAFLTVRVSRRAGPEGVRQLASWIAPLALLGLALTLIAAGGPDAGAVRDAAQRSVATMLAVPLLFAVLIGAVALAAPAVQWPVANPVARRLGDVSYGVFLLHFMVIELALHSLDFAHDGSGSAFAKLFAFAIPVTLALAWLSWVLVERPIRRWARSAADVGREVAPDRGALVAGGGHLDQG